MLRSDRIKNRRGTQAAMPQQGTELGVRGLALRQQATRDLAIAHLRPTIPEHEIRQHQHAEMHLLLLLSGHYVSDAAGMPEVCAEAAVLLNPPGTEHRDRFRSRDGAYVVVTMPQEAFARVHDGVAVGDQAVRLPRQSLGRAMRLLDELWRWDDASPLAVEAIFSELVADAQTRPPSFGAGDRIQRAMDRLASDVGEPPSLEELASIADCHPVYLARAFRKRYGLSPSDYLRKRRLHKAVSLIARRRTLSGVASMLGFVDESHLHRSFVAEFGMTPGAFRRLALGRREVARIQDSRLRGR
jgi:AraC family transcriptional regulator